MNATGKASYIVNDSYPEPYLVAAPCREPDTSSCPACHGKFGASAYQMEPWSSPKSGCQASRCFSLGSVQYPASVSYKTDPTKGLQYKMTHGDNGRSVVFDLVCNQADSGPQSVKESSEVYTITWKTPAACPKFDASEQCAAPTPPPAPTTAPTPLPRPTSAQLDWMKLEMGGCHH